VTRSELNCTANGIHWWQGDFADIESARRIFKNVRPDLIFHLAGLVTAAADVDLVLPTLHSLTVSTVNTLVVANEFGCDRLLLAASLTEPESPLAYPVPTSPYMAAKWAASTYARMCFNLYRLPVVILRPFMTYGPRQSVQKLIPYVTISLLKGEAPRLSKGDWAVDWIYVDDITDAFMSAAVAPGVEGRTIDLGSGTLVNVMTIVRHLVKLTGGETEPMFGAIGGRPFEEVRHADLRTAEGLLGWRPVTPLMTGLKRTVAWYKQQIKDGLL
jgi:nucleoside-diphosphate-sugar epimerase